MGDHETKMFHPASKRIDVSVGESVQIIRELQGCSQNELAKLTDVRQRQTAECPSDDRSFFSETGIKESDWYGKYWVRWSDALREAGLPPNRMNEAYNEQLLIEKVISLARELGRFPVAGDLRMKAHNDASFPSHNVFGRLGSKNRLIQKVRTTAERTKARMTF
jgi:hypothetical protein